MKKTAKKTKKSQAKTQSNFHLTLTTFVRHTLQDFVVREGMKALSEVLLEEQEALCGPKHKKPDSKDDAQRWGTAQGRLSFGGQRVLVERPRVRKGGKEIPLQTWDDFSEEDPLNNRAFEQMVVGVSTRSFERTLDDLPEELGSHGTSKSAASRRFSKKTGEQLEAWLSRPLGEFSLIAIMLDGIVVDGQAVLVALGITEEGEKEPLGLWVGSTENASVVQSLLNNLVERGLDPMVRRLFVIDGGKALRKAIRDTFGKRALIQRCQVHKVRNVLDHLPEKMRPSVAAQMKAAYRSKSKSMAKKKLLKLKDHLDNNYPDAAASLREGLDETLSIKDIGLPDALERTLSTTNMLENLNGSIRRVTRNVKRWQNGEMIKRWVVAGILEAGARFRRLRGYKGLSKLSNFLQETAGQNAQLDDGNVAA